MLSMAPIVWTRESAGGTPALVGKDGQGRYRAYAAPDVDDPLWTLLERVRFDLALGAMPAPDSGLRTLTLSDLLTEAPPEHHGWIRDVTADVFDRQLRELRVRVAELDADGEDEVDLRQLAAIAAAAASVREQLAGAA